MRVFSWFKHRWVIGGLLLIVTTVIVIVTMQTIKPQAQLNNGGADFASFQSYCAGVGGQFVLGRGCYDGQPNTGIFMESKGWWYRDYIIAFCQQGPCTNDTCSHGASCTSGECPISACPAGSTPSYAGDGGYYTGLVCANTYYGQQCGNTAFRPGYINGCTMFAAYDSSGTYQPTGPNCGVGNQCTVDADCPVSTETCRVNKCVSGTCQVQIAPDGYACGPTPPNDPYGCLQNICAAGYCTTATTGLNGCSCTLTPGGPHAFQSRMIATIMSLSLKKPIIVAAGGACTNNDSTSCNFPDSCNKVEYTNTWSGPGCCDGGGSNTMILTADPGQNYATLNFSDACNGAANGTTQVPVCPCNSSQSSAASSNSSASSGGSNSSRSSTSSRSSASSGGSNSSASGNSNSSRSSVSSRVSSQSSRPSSVSSQSRSSSRSSRNSGSSNSSRSSVSSNNSGSSQSSGGSSRSSRNSSDGSGSSRSSGGSNSSRSGSSVSGSSRSSRNSSDGSGSSRSSGGSNSSRSGSSVSGSSRSSRNSSDGSGSSRSGSSVSGSSRSSRNSSDGFGSSRSSGGSNSSRSGSSVSGSSRSSFRNSSQSSFSIGVCRGDECARGGDLFCADMGGTCETLSDLPCIQCAINDSSSSIRSSRRSSRSSIGVDGGGIAGDDGGDDSGDGGDNNGDGGDDSPDIWYCGDGFATGNEECDDGNGQGGDGCTAQCRIEASIGFCTGRECNEGGSDVCGSFGLTCEGTNDLPCIQCVDTQGIPQDMACNNNGCAAGGNSICTDFGMSCIEDSENPCFLCETTFAASSSTANASIAVMNCSGQECSEGGNSLCGAFGLSCTESGDLPCISCVNAEQTVVQPSCAVDGCLAGGKNICDAQGLGCRASDTGACFECTNKEGTMVAVASPFICGNGRVEPGEECDNGALNSDAISALCRINCRRAGCGDGILDAPLEVCDDGNTVNGDGCSQICTLERTAPNQTLPGQIIELPFLPGNGSSISGDTSGNGSISGVAPVTPLPASTPDTGPAAIAVMAAGAAAGYSYMKRRRL